MTQIIKKETFEVDGRGFRSEKDAQDYINQRDNEKIIQEYNSQLLESHGGLFIPIYDPEEQSIDIFIKTEIENSGGWSWWKSLIDNRELRYYDKKLNILTNDEFMEEFKKHPSLYIESNQWNSFIMGIIYLNENAKNPLDWRELIELAGQMQVTPQYIYND